MGFSPAKLIEIDTHHIIQACDCLKFPFDGVPVDLHLLLIDQDPLRIGGVTLGWYPWVLPTHLQHLFVNYSTNSVHADCTWPNSESWQATEVCLCLFMLLWQDFSKPTYDGHISMIQPMATSTRWSLKWKFEHKSLCNQAHVVNIYYKYKKFMMLECRNERF